LTEDKHGSHFPASPRTSYHAGLRYHEETPEPPPTTETLDQLRANALGEHRGHAKAALDPEALLDDDYDVDGLNDMGTDVTAFTMDPKQCECAPTVLRALHEELRKWAKKTMGDANRYRLLNL
jgi:hypothetical protein